MTVLSGFAQTYWHLLLARMGVGLGEAGGTPPATSMIADLYPPSQRATALGVYTLGIGLGILAGFPLGGYVYELYGWRAAFFFAGAPGLVLASRPTTIVTITTTIIVWCNQSKGLIRQW